MTTHRLVVEIPDGDYDLHPSEWDAVRLFLYLDAGHAEIVDYTAVGEPEPDGEPRDVSALGPRTFAERDFRPAPPRGMGQR